MATTINAPAVGVRNLMSSTDLRVYYDSTRGLVFIGPTFGLLATLDIDLLNETGGSIDVYFDPAGDDSVYVDGNEFVLSDYATLGDLATAISALADITATVTGADWVSPVYPEIWDALGDSGSPTQIADQTTAEIGSITGPLAFSASALAARTLAEFVELAHSFNFSEDIGLFVAPGAEAVNAGTVDWASVVGTDPADPLTIPDTESDQAFTIGTYSKTIGTTNTPTAAGTEVVNGVANAIAAKPFIEHMDAGGRCAVTGLGDSNFNQVEAVNGGDWRRWCADMWGVIYGWVGMAGMTPTAVGATRNVNWRFRNFGGISGAATAITSSAARAVLDARFEELYCTGINGARGNYTAGDGRLGWNLIGAMMFDGNTFNSGSDPNGILSVDAELADIGIVEREGIYGADGARLSMTFGTFPGSPGDTTAQPQLGFFGQGGARNIPQFSTVDPSNIMQIMFQDWLTSSTGTDPETTTWNGTVDIYADRLFQTKDYNGPLLLMSAGFSDHNASGVCVAPMLDIRGGQSWFHHAVAMRHDLWRCDIISSDGSTDSGGAEYGVSATKIADDATGGEYEQGPSLELKAQWLRHLRHHAQSSDGSEGYVVIRYGGSGNGLGDDQTGAKRYLPGSPADLNGANQAAKEALADNADNQIYNLKTIINELQAAWEHPLCAGDRGKLLHVVALSHNAAGGDATNYSSEILSLHEAYLDEFGGDNPEYSNVVVYDPLRMFTRTEQAESGMRNSAIRVELQNAGGTDIDIYEDSGTLYVGSDTFTLASYSTMSGLASAINTANSDLAILTPSGVGGIDPSASTGIWNGTSGDPTTVEAGTTGVVATSGDNAHASAFGYHVLAAHEAAFISSAALAATSSQTGQTRLGRSGARLLGGTLC